MGGQVGEPQLALLTDPTTQRERQPCRGATEVHSAPVCMGSSVKTQSCFLLGSVGNLGDGCQKWFSLIKTIVKMYPIFYAQGVSLFLLEAREKSTLQSTEVFTCHGPFSVLFSTCVTGSDLTSLHTSDQCVTSSRNHYTRPGDLYSHVY